MRSRDDDSESTRKMYAHDAAAWTAASGHPNKLPQNAIRLETVIAVEELGVRQGKNSLERPDIAQERNISDLV